VVHRLQKGRIPVETVDGFRKRGKVAVRVT